MRKFTLQSARASATRRIIAARVQAGQLLPIWKQSINIAIMKQPAIFAGGDPFLVTGNIQTMAGMVAKLEQGNDEPSL
jgi:hypothetical protein